MGSWSAGPTGLDGSLRPVRGVIARPWRHGASGARARLWCPLQWVRSALGRGSGRSWPRSGLEISVEAFCWRTRARPSCCPVAASHQGSAPPELADVRGSGAHGRRRLEIAAAGTHHLLLVGRPEAARRNAGKASCWPAATPSRAEALELTPGVFGGGLLRPRHGPVRNGRSAVASRPNA